jgi:hypothetical protein
MFIHSLSFSSRNCSQVDFYNTQYCILDAMDYRVDWQLFERSSSSKKKKRKRKTYCILTLAFKTTAEASESYLSHSKSIITKWNLYTSMIMKDLALRNAKSFSKFHTIHFIHLIKFSPFTRLLLEPKDIPWWLHHVLGRREHCTCEPCSCTIC